MESYVFRPQIVGSRQHVEAFVRLVVKLSAPGNNQTPDQQQEERDYPKVIGYKETLCWLPFTALTLEDALDTLL